VLRWAVGLVAGLMASAAPELAVPLLVKVEAGRAWGSLGPVPGAA
jgi:DNA polymerase I-like protein with 3'-5' exonuclease and polymerase domains